MTGTQGSRAILTIGQDAVQQGALRRVLVGRYAGLETASGSAEAIGLLVAGQHAVVLVDMGTPDVDGLAFVRHGLAVSPHSVFILISERDSDELDIADAPGGSCLHLPMQWEDTELLEVVARAEYLSRARRGAGERAASSTTLERLLLVEDDSWAAAMAERHLHQSGVAKVIEHATSLSAAQDRLSAASYDAIVTDLNLPDASGMDAVRKMRELAPTASLIVWSGGDEHDSSWQAFELGAHDWFSKDRDPRGLPRVVDRATMRVRRESELQRAASYDALTGFMKAEALRGHLSELCQREDTASIGLAVIYLDLDGFKPINDTHGHDAGDAVLRHVGQRLANVLRRGDEGGRMGGDEFALVLTGVRSGPDAEGVAKRILGLLAQPIALPNGQMTSISASAGVALACTSPHADASSLLTAADKAMLVAKRASPGQFRFAEALSSNDDDALDRPRIEAGRGLYLEFQPQVDLRDRRVRCMEALLRLRARSGRTLRGRDLIPQLQKDGHALKVGRWTIEAAVRTLAQQRRRYPYLRVAINLFTAQLWDRDLPNFISRVTADHGLPPTALDLELDAASFARSLGEAEARIAELRARGLRVVLDDFGAGGGSLDAIRVLAVDGIKLAPELIAPLGETRRASHFLEGILRLADAVGLEVVAKGVEKPCQLAVLTDLGCAACQGYLLGRPHFVGPSGRLQAAA